MAQTNYIPKIAYHPGETLREKLDEMQMSVKEFAVRTNKPEKTIYAVINGDSSLTTDMAVAFENVTGIPAHFWINKQRNFDEYVARQKQAVQLSQACVWATLFPYAQMVKYGWIHAHKNIEDRAMELLRFFRISSIDAWEKYYLSTTSSTHFRVSLYATKEPYAISAWLCRGEQQMQDTSSLLEYSPTQLKKRIDDMKQLMVKQPNDFATQLQEMCAGVGIKLVYTPCLPKAPISGSTRWKGNTPCIQLLGRYKQYDIFWFTFFHEIGHILLHGKKNIFLENVSYEDSDASKEEEADKFAADIMLSQDAETEIVQNKQFSKHIIEQYAVKFNTHPSVIVGRLHHKGILPYSKGTDFRISVNLFPN